MSLPTQSDTLVNGYLFNGEPFIAYEPNSTIDSLHNGYLHQGESFAAVSAHGGFNAAWACCSNSVIQAGAIHA